MTEQLRDFLNQHRDLIENDNIYELVNKASSYSSYYKELLQMLKECGAFEDYDDFLNEFIKKYERDTLAIEKKHQVDGFTSILSAKSYAIYDAVSLDNFINLASKTITMLPIATGAIPPRVPNDYKPSIYLDMWEYRVSLRKDGDESATFRCSPPRPDFFFMDILYPEKSNQHLKDYLEQYEKFCVKTNECIDNCINSFDWTEKAMEYAYDIAPELKKRAAEYIDIEPQIIKAGNGVFINSGLKNTKDNIRIIIPCDSDPSCFDVEKAIKECVAKIKRLAGSRAKAAKVQAETEAQRPENYKEVTRRDITACMKKLGFRPSSTCYTNKHPKVTTYKYAFMHLSPTECQELYDALRKEGADVESVDCSISGTGWRSYESVFVKIRN